MKMSLYKGSRDGPLGGKYKTFAEYLKRKCTILQTTLTSSKTFAGPNFPVCESCLEKDIRAWCKRTVS